MVKRWPRPFRGWAIVSNSGAWGLERDVHGYGWEGGLPAMYRTRADAKSRAMDGERVVRVVLTIDNPLIPAALLGWR